MADESRWDEDERRRRWEEERYRRGGQYGRESQYGREGWREMTGRRDEDYGRDWRGLGYGEGRDMGYGHGGGSYAGEGYRGEGGRSEGYRGGYSQSYGGAGYARPSYYDPYRRWPTMREGYVGFGPEQGFWRTPEDDREREYRMREYRREYPRYGYGGYSGYGGYEGERGYRGHGDERGFFERAGDEVASWFGDEEAERRRQMDAMREGRHRGRGPRGYTRSDERIREDVCDRLADDPMVDASEVEVQVRNGEVTLNGTVHSRWLKRRTEDITDDISGVRHVQNNLRVQEWGSQQAGGTSVQTAGTTATATGASATSGSTGTTTGTTRSRERS